MEHPTRTEAPAKIAGFWKRIFAMIADSALLGAVGWLATFQFADSLIALGTNGRILGLGVSILYFGVLNSRIGGGATLGKRLFGLRVVRRSGAKLGLLRSLLRAVIYLVPLYLNGWFIALPPLQPWQQIAFSTVDLTVVFGMGVAMIYLYIANVSTRQTLHDLAVSSFVVTEESAGTSVVGYTHRTHLVIVALWMLLFLAGIPLAWSYLPNIAASNPFGLNVNGLTAVQDAVVQVPGVLSAQVTQNSSSVWSEGKKETVTSLNVLVDVDHRVSEQQAKTFAEGVARRVLATSPNILGEQKLKVTVRYGYDIGVWKQSQSFNFIDTPSAWRTALLQTR
jgi:uncharacterized RDD family membrane protein YckC